MPTAALGGWHWGPFTIRSHLLIILPTNPARKQDTDMFLQLVCRPSKHLPTRVFIYLSQRHPAPLLCFLLLGLYFMSIPKSPQSPPLWTLYTWNQAAFQRGRVCVENSKTRRLLPGPSAKAGRSQPVLEQERILRIIKCSHFSELFKYSETLFLSVIVCRNPVCKTERKEAVIAKRWNIIWP